ncbi:MAG: phosphoribosylamine---glycine ligase [Actinomycetota bacterium]|nr:phosphoribosylamine---glycine ligase [Actinomycetota bacterium]
MKVCILGGGGREHALAWAAAKFGHDTSVVPGNAGNPWSVPAEPVDADLYVLGSDDAVVSGQGDRLRTAGKLVFGPNADGGQLEGSKAWMKELLVDAGVPTARHGSFTDVEGATRFLRTLPGPYVVKTDYLALGKGVLVTPDLDDAIADARAKLEHGGVVIEECMEGPEISVFAVCDGSRAVLLPPAQDFKRIGDGDVGPNTGGMGSVAPVPIATKEVVDEVMERCIQPTLDALRARGIDYRGVLYSNPMLTAEGPKIVEYNVRFGDPEAQCLLPLFESDPVALLAEAAAGELRTEPRFSDRACVTVALAAEGYPATPRRGDKIVGIDDAGALEDVVVFSAGVGPGWVTDGGRVLNVTALGSDVADARERAYRAVDMISWRGMYCRRDIGAKY